MKVIFQLVPLLAAALHVSAHGVITAVSGTNGVTGAGFGVVATTPRDGSRRNLFQQDSSIIRDKEISSGKADVCGRTLGGGVNNVQTMLAAASTAGLPTAAPDGSVQMTLHQVNGDGAGPYTCQVSADATGQNFVAMTVTTQVPGKNSRSNAKATDFPLVAQMPAGMTCTGGPNGDACLVRCRNAATAGPFGGCVAGKPLPSSFCTQHRLTATLLPSFSHHCRQRERCSSRRCRYCHWRCRNWCRSWFQRRKRCRCRRCQWCQWCCRRCCAW
ncbi:hypothetical protein PLEOSDRAFT_1031192 [Pleurotus ostreatus PC15]|uniref:GEgh 16 protein n=1 Tax=Pleurotus ostreatus (strain PC15) TaxID=1137138 RepID=A0A067P9E1_PLEO1|nr:hypothetical protein PLEOSDRAFT_1031192 [Pleurotus ostreatus PC15]